MRPMAEDRGWLADCGRNFGVKALMTQYTTTAMDEETCEFFFVQERVLYRIDFNSLGLQEKVIGE